MESSATAASVRPVMDKIGWFGCAHLDRLLSVEAPIPGTYPKVLDLTCPAGFPHKRQAILWRHRKLGERGELQPQPASET